MKKIIALIPAYKPDIKLIELLKDLKSETIESIVINDGSGTEFDRIFEAAKDYATVISHDVNYGKGKALKTGLLHIEKTFEDYIVVTLDADGQHTIADAKKVCDIVQKDPYVLALGSRFFDKSTPLRSRFGNAMTRLVYKLSTGISVYDTQTGLRAFSDKILHKFIDIKGDRYEYEINVLLECKNLKIKIVETKIATIYIDNNSSSHFNPIKDSIRIYKNILKFSASSLVSFLIDYLLYSLFFIIFKTSGVFKPALVSNVCSRCISSVVNFTINRKYVFKSDKSILKSIVEYYILVIFILVANTIILDIFVSVLSINVYFAKIITEILFFFISYATQKLFVFKNKK